MSRLNSVCVCNATADDENQFRVTNPASIEAFQCALCQKSFHYRCVGVDLSLQPPMLMCPTCVGQTVLPLPDSIYFLKQALPLPIHQLPAMFPLPMTQPSAMVFPPPMSLQQAQMMLPVPFQQVPGSVPIGTPLHASHIPIAQPGASGHTQPQFVTIPLHTSQASADTVSSNTYSVLPASPQVSSQEDVQETASSSTAPAPRRRRTADEADSDYSTGEEDDEELLVVDEAAVAMPTQSRFGRTIKRKRVLAVEDFTGYRGQSRSAGPDALPIHALAASHKMKHKHPPTAAANVAAADRDVAESSAVRARSSQHKAAPASKSSSARTAVAPATQLSVFGVTFPEHVDAARMRVRDALARVLEKAELDTIEAPNQAVDAVEGATAVPGPGASADERARHARLVGGALEHAMYCELPSARYIERARAVIGHLKDPRNAALRVRVFRGEMEPVEVARADDDQLLPAEVLEEKRRNEMEVLKDRMKVGAELEAVVMGAERMDVLARALQESKDDRGSSARDKEEEEEAGFDAALFTRRREADDDGTRSGASSAQERPTASPTTLARAESAGGDESPRPQDKADEADKQADRAPSSSPAAPDVGSPSAAVAAVPTTFRMGVRARALEEEEDMGLDLDALGGAEEEEESGQSGGAAEGGSALDMLEQWSAAAGEEHGEEIVKEDEGDNVDRLAASLCMPVPAEVYNGSFTFNGRTAHATFLQVGGPTLVSLFPPGATACGMGTLRATRVQDFLRDLRVRGAHRVICTLAVELTGDCSSIERQICPERGNAIVCDFERTHGLLVYVLGGGTEVLDPAFCAHVLGLPRPTDRLMARYAEAGFARFGVPGYTQRVWAVAVLNAEAAKNFLFDPSSATTAMPPVSQHALAQWQRHSAHAESERERRDHERRKELERKEREHREQERRPIDGPISPSAAAAPDAVPVTSSLVRFASPFALASGAQVPAVPAQSAAPTDSTLEDLSEALAGLPDLASLSNLLTAVLPSVTAAPAPAPLLGAAPVPAYPHQPPMPVQGGPLLGAAPPAPAPLLGAAPGYPPSHAPPHSAPLLGAAPVTAPSPSRPHAPPGAPLLGTTPRPPLASPPRPHAPPPRAYPPPPHTHTHTSRPPVNYPHAPPVPPVPPAPHRPGYPLAPSPLPAPARYDGYDDDPTAHPPPQWSVAYGTTVQPQPPSSSASYGAYGAYGYSFAGDAKRPPPPPPRR